MAFPTDHAWREYQVFLRGPAGLNLLAYGTVDALRSGVQHVGLIVGFPEPSDNTADDFGIQQGGGFTVEIADEGNDDDWPLLDSNGDVITSDDTAAALVQDYGPPGHVLAEDGSRLLLENGDPINLES